MNGYPVTPAQEFPTHPEWPVYEAPARWYISPSPTSTDFKN